MKWLSQQKLGLVLARSRGFAPNVEPLEDRCVPSTTYTVLNNSDSGAGSLRQAILAANANPGADTVVFAKSLHHIKLTSGELLITDSLHIDGRGPNKVTVSGNGSSRVFDVASGVATIDGLTVADGLAGPSAPVFASTGGGILVQAGASLTLGDVVVADCRAVGEANGAVPRFIGGYFLTGAGGGGGIANLGSLTVTGSKFTGNQARGGDGASGPAFPSTTFPGLALGGAIYNLASANVSDSRFNGNVAQAGHGGSGAYAAIGGGGAIYNDAALTVIGSSFRHNRASGGNDSISDVHNGHGIGGAIVSGSVVLLTAGSATLAVSQSTFAHNQASGGNRNQLTGPLVGPGNLADQPNVALGGAVLAFQGSATLSHSELKHNQARGGAGAAGQTGGAAGGGGVFFFNFLGNMAGPLTATVDCSTIANNDALGGPGGSGGRGGHALGGGLGAGALGNVFAALFGSATTVTVSGSAVDHNFARGGCGSSGGDGLGGGAFNDAGATLNLTAAAVTHNRAKGGEGCGADGQGIGGGVYNLGLFTFDAFTVIKKNHASTSHDNVFG